MNRVEDKAAQRARCRIASTRRIVASLAATGALLSGQASLIDKWDADSLTGSVLDGGEIILWPSQNGVNAWPDYTLPSLSTFHANGTPAGGPVVRLSGSAFEVDAGDSPLQGLSEFTLSVVVKFNAPSTRPGGAHWGSKTGLIDANNANDRADWGTALTREGDVGFGVGQPDTSLYTTSGSAVDDRFHVVVVTWKAGEVQKLYLDNWDPIAAEDPVPAGPREASRMTFGSSSVGGDVDQLLSGDLVEVRFYDTVMTDAEALAEANALATTHGVQFTRLIDSFAASTTEINAGESLTLSWEVAPDAAMQIQPGIGDITGQPTGNREVTPAKDTLYTLIATRDTVTNQAVVDIIVRRAAEDALVDVWDAAAVNEGAITSWTSANGRIAASATPEPAVAVPSATPAGTPAVEFARSLLSVAGQQNPLAGLTEATIAYVFKANEPPTRNDGVEWSGKTGILDASQDGATNDWGCVLDENGQAGFGIGNPDGTLYSAGESLADGQWHVAIQTWNAGRMRLYVDERPVIASAGQVSRSPRGNGNLVFGGAADLSGDGMFVGQLAEVRFYNDGLAETEVAKVRDELAAKHGLGGGASIDPFPILASGFNNDGDYFVTIASVPGITYRLQKKAGLGDGEWADVASAGASGAELTLTDTGAGSGGGFYRVVADASSGSGGTPFPILGAGFTVANSFAVTFEAVPGGAYELLKKDGLAGATWTSVASGTATAATLTLTDTEATNPNAFYRVSRSR
ncbi:MAG: hypothetical protein H7A45_19660 [Verrucomicrobiales bacterium]|nr:hypothetical protein [Verrucomicrobiales bacterium]